MDFHAIIRQPFNGVLCTCPAKLWLSATSLRCSSPGVKIREKNGKVVPFFLSSGSSTNEIKRFFLRDGAVCLFSFLDGRTYKLYSLQFILDCGHWVNCKNRRIVTYFAAALACFLSFGVLSIYYLWRNTAACFFWKKAFVSLLVKVYGAVMAKQQESTVITKLRELTRDLTIAREKKSCVLGILWIAVVSQVYGTAAGRLCTEALFSFFAVFLVGAAFVLFCS